MGKLRKGDTVTLIGKTRHGKNRVREQGSLWTVTGESASPHWFPSPSGRVLHLEAGGHWRMVATSGDKNFVAIPNRPCSDCGIPSQHTQCPQCWSMDQLIPWRE